MTYTAQHQDDRLVRARATRRDLAERRRCAVLALVRDHQYGVETDADLERLIAGLRLIDAALTRAKRTPANPNGVMRPHDLRKHLYRWGLCGRRTIE